MIRRRADIGRVVPGKIDTILSILYQQGDVLLNLAPPARPALVTQVISQEAERLQPDVGIPVAVESRFVSTLLALARQQVADTDRKIAHPGVAIPLIGGMLFCVENGRCEYRVRKVPPSTTLRLEGLQIGRGF